MLKTAFEIFKEVIKWVVFIFVFSIFWFGVTIFNPNMRCFLIPFVILFLVFNFPKTLFVLIITQLKLLKDTFFKDTSTADAELMAAEGGVIELEEEFSPLEEIIYKGCIVISIVFLCLIVYKYFHNKHIENEIAKYNMEHSDIDMSMDPIQVMNPEKKTFYMEVGGKEFSLTPLAKYKIAGVVVVKNTLIFDGGRLLAPVDLGIVWGDMAKPENYQKITFYSNFRLMSYSWAMGYKPNMPYLRTHSSHNHIIPANEDVNKAVMALKKNDKVILEGYLVEVNGKGMKPWRSSLRRDDHLFNSGAGCEIFYVEKVKSI